MNAPAQLISLDVDGTLYRVRRLRTAWRLRSQRGFLMALVAARERIRHGAPPADGAALRELQVEALAASFNTTHEQAEARLHTLEAALPAALTAGSNPFSGLRGALEAAVARGLKIAVLSDYPPDEKLRLLGLDDLPWAATLAADETGALKPDPRSFLALSEATGIAPSAVVHVGDREDLDVKGALQAGMRAWRFAEKGATHSRAERVFGRYLIDIFADLGTGPNPSSQ